MKLFILYKVPGYYYKVCFLFLVLFNSGCRKLLEVDLPITKTPASEVYASSSTAISAMTGIYTRLSAEGSFSGIISPVLGSALADELETNSGIPEYTNSVDSRNCLINGLWDLSYRTVLFSVNSLIEGVNASEGIPDDIRQVLLGEAKFVRALIYFHLVNFWGDVPLVLTSDFKVNSNLARSSKDIVYAQIIKDLLDAQLGLKDQYLFTDLETNTTERVRPNKSAATALLARVYLYAGEWDKAEIEASKLIQNTALYDTVALDQVFLKNSKETIWSLQPVGYADAQSANTRIGTAFLNPYNNPPEISARLSPFLLSAFENNDNRKISWATTVTDYAAINYIVPYKYKAGLEDPVQKEYTVVLRLAEQYLIRAEARAQLGNTVGAIEDINVIRTRAGLPNTPASEPMTLLDAIEKERYVELFTEWGHRWFDLKRTGKLDARMETVSPTKGGIWEPFKALMPIPQEEIEKNSALNGFQNPGYEQ